jgi:hypothetical protein
MRLLRAHTEIYSPLASGRPLISNPETKRHGRASSCLNDALLFIFHAMWHVVSYQQISTTNIDVKDSPNTYTCILHHTKVYMWWCGGVGVFKAILKWPVLASFFLDYRIRGVDWKVGCVLEVLEVDRIVWGNFLSKRTKTIKHKPKQYKKKKCFCAKGGMHTLIPLIAWTIIVVLLPCQICSFSFIFFCQKHSLPPPHTPWEWSFPGPIVPWPSVRMIVAWRCKFYNTMWRVDTLNSKEII